MSNKIAIDVTPFAYAPMSGTGVYVRNVVREMLDLANGYEIHLISSKKCDLNWACGAKIWFGEGELARHNIAWWALRGERLLGEIDADVFWSPFQFLPIGVTKKRRLVFTVLDLVWRHMPSVMEGRNYLWNRALMSRSISKASGIIAISEATKRDILDCYDTNGSGIYAIYLAFDPVFRPVEAGESCEVLKKYGLSDRCYILSVGALEPRKNHLMLARAIEKLRGDNAFDCDLVIVGSGGWKNSEFLEYANRAKEWIHILRDVSADDLCGLYNIAELFAFPSLMEGFGIPILEAMACGCPVVTSNVSSMPEVAGEAAVLVNPYDVDDIARGITEAQKRRDELRRLGLSRANQFSWKKSAAKHLDVLIG